MIRMSADVAVGIDDLNLYAGPLAIEFAELASVRGFTNEDLARTEFQRRSVLPPFEDVVTIAVNAARPIVRALDPDSIRLLIVATETGVDHAKPISTYIHRYLDLGPHCRNFEIKHACYAGTAALQMAAGWLRSQGSAEDKALVITTDLAGSAGRLARHPSELTSGEGAVAFTISRNPRVLRLDNISGYATREVYDVARPQPTIEVADPLLSLTSYLDLLDLSWDDYKRRSTEIRLDESFKYVVYHTPLFWLVRQAHRSWLESGDDFITEEEFDESFRRMVLPSLVHNAHLGNIYSGSAYAALAGLIADLPSPVQACRVGIFSYGSGACAEFLSGWVEESGPDVVAAHHIGEQLRSRDAVTVDTYEVAAQAIEQSLSSACFIPEANDRRWCYEEAYRGRDLLVLDRVEDYRRNYRWS
jgi:3-hydroxy-3-methylglutaryl CoA synthase